MPVDVEQQWQVVQQIHHELRQKVKDNDHHVSVIEDLTQQLRQACEMIQFTNFDYAAKKDIDGVLWDCHTICNQRFRRLISRFKSPEQKKSVERRKWDKYYIDFLKKSQVYYKGYIQRLASHFGGLTELRIIAHRLTLPTLAVDRPVQVSKETEKLILLSCHFALLRLGDIYRYRSELNTRDRSWEKAAAHYALANDLYPDGGSAFNQLAVVSLADGNHLDAVYYLYRALAVNEPHTLAESNLAIEFKKINTIWLGNGQKKANTTSVSPKTPAASMVLWFVRLHAKLYKGEEFPNHDELENEVLSQMTVLLKEQPLEGILDKIVLVNIAAEYVASTRYAANHEASSLQAYLFYLRLNVRMFFMLLQLLQPELDYSTNGQDAPDVTGKKQEKPTETITAVTRRILPALRQYSIWLVATAPVIVAQRDMSSNVHIKEMWSMYCTTLNLLLNAFPKSLESCEVDYLLEEDAATVGFKPFRDSYLCQIYTDGHGNLKKRTTDPGVSRHHPNIEMFARIKGLLQDGVDLAQMEESGHKICPISVVDGEFRFSEDGVPQISPTATPGPFRDENEYQNQYQGAYDQRFAPDSPVKNVQAPSVAPSESQQSLSRDMHQMVEDLLTPSKMPQPSHATHAESNGTPYSMSNTMSSTTSHHRRPSEMMHSIPVSRSLSQQHLQSKVFGLPGFTSAFAPRPGELEGSTSLADGGNMPIHQMSAANFAAFGRPMTPSQMNLEPPPYLQSWQRTTPSHVGPQHYQPQQPEPKLSVAQELQQALSSQFQTPGFSNQSSIYQNSPGFAHPPPGFGVRQSAADQQRQMLLDAAFWNGDASPRRSASGQNGHMR